MRVSVSWFSNSDLPTAVVTNPSSTNTTVNPSTNRLVSSVIRASTRGCLSSLRISPIDTPVSRLR